MSRYLSERSTLRGLLDVELQLWLDQSPEAARGAGDFWWTRCK